MSYELLSTKLETINAISITPFNPETKAIDWTGVEQNINFLIDNGIEVIVPCGNTSEFYALSLEEAKEEIRRVVEIVNGRAVVVAGIGYSVPIAVELGIYASKVGADAVMIHQPIHPYITNRGATSYYRNIIEALDIPSIVYFKEPHISDEVIIELAPLDKLIGVKYAINDLPRFTKLVREVSPSHNITWLCGTAEKWAPFFYSSGAKGFTSGLVNVHPKLSFELLQALLDGDQEEVWKLWSIIMPFENLRAKYNNGNNVVVIKEAMNQLNLNAGITREPVDPLDEKDIAEVKAILKSWGLL